METKTKPKFRSLPKDGVEFQLPTKLAKLVRRHVNGYRTISVVGTEIVAKGLGLNPADFGVESTIPGPSLPVVADNV